MPLPRSWTDEQLVIAVAASRTLQEVHQRLGLKAGKYDLMRKHIERLGIDASHLPRARVGEKLDSGKVRKFRDDELVEAVRLEQTVHGVLRRLGYELDDINGDHTDNRLENLRILCPNCHAQTDTWCGRKRRRTPAAERHGLDP